MYIGLIDWPSDSKQLRELFLDYQTKVLVALNINFNECKNNPMEIAKLFIDNKISPEEYNQNINYYWNFIDKSNAIRDFNNKDILMARLALSIMIKEDILPQIGENLSWFLELINNLGHNLDLPIEIMRSHFSFNKLKK